MPPRFVLFSICKKLPEICKKLPVAASVDIENLVRSKIEFNKRF